MRTTLYTLRWAAAAPARRHFPCTTFRFSVPLHKCAFHIYHAETSSQFDYRLRYCGELSLGIFTSLEDSDTVTAATSAPVYSGAPKRKSVLLGHIIATKTTNPTVTDKDMQIPDSSSSEKAGLGDRP